MRDSIVGAGARIGAGSRVEERTIVGEGADRLGQRAERRARRRRARLRSPTCVALRRLDCRADAGPDARADRGGRRRRTRSTTCSRCRSTSRTRSGGSSRRGSSASLGRPRRPDARCSSAAWAAARSAATSPRRRSATALTQAAAHGPRLRAAVVGDARLGRPVRELLRQHRGDARLLRGRGRARRASRVAVTTGGRLAEAARADGVPVIPLPAGLQPRAAVAYMLVSVLEVAALVRRRARACGPRSTRPRRSLDGAGARVGARTRTPTASRSGSPQRVHRTLRLHLRRRADAPVATRWKTQINENAKVPAFCGRAARGRPQRDRRLGERRRRSAASWRCSWRTSDQHPRVRQRDRADRAR